MKRLIFLFIAALAITSCQKDPSMSDLDNEFLVYTNYDTGADFASFSTYFVPDSILLMGTSKTAKYWKGADAEKIVDAFVANMNARGYTREEGEDARETADLGIQLSYVEDETLFVSYNNPYWWYDYPYYWAPDYWGNWYGWYYPFPIVYGYTSGSLLAELLDLKADQGSGKKLPVIWNAFAGGLLSGSKSLNLDRTVTAVNQAFTQSPYLKK